MVFNNFRVNVLLRITIVVALSLALAWSWRKAEWIVTPLVCGAFIIFSYMSLIHYVETTTRELSAFLSYIAHHDFATPRPALGKGKLFWELQNAYRVLAESYRRLNLQKVAEHQSLEAVLEHVGVALTCFDGEGVVNMLNEPARRLFGIPHLNSLRTFSRIDRRLPEMLERLGEGERRLLDVQRGDDYLQLVLYATTFELIGKRYKIVSFQNIRNELEQREIESWHKLTRVLTHEIMNSVTPITSLSRLIRETMIDESGQSPALRVLSPQEQHDMLRSVSAIHTRSTGLLGFVQAYRNFTQLPSPVFTDLNVRSLLERVRILMAQEIESRGVEFSVQCADGGLILRADPSQMEQVLINLVRNALDALTESAQPRIALRGLRDDQEQILLQVLDNGAGIAPEHLDDIFVPFFTTKRHGTGVGLSISRQIVHANNGGISVRSPPGEGTVFTLRFR